MKKERIVKGNRKIERNMLRGIVGNKGLNIAWKSKQLDEGKKLFLTNRGNWGQGEEQLANRLSESEKASSIPAKLYTLQEFFRKKKVQIHYTERSLI